jgi:hypothetical protein
MMIGAEYEPGLALLEVQLRAATRTVQMSSRRQSQAGQAGDPALDLDAGRFFVDRFLKRSGVFHAGNGVGHAELLSSRQVGDVWRQIRADVSPLDRFYEYAPSRPAASLKTWGGVRRSQPKRIARGVGAPVRTKFEPTCR